MNIKEAAALSKSASIKLGAVSGLLKNKALKEIALALSEKKEEIIKANIEDIERSEGENLAKPLLKRLKFDETKIQSIIDGIESLIGLEDPVKKTLLSTELDEGLELYKISCPIGVIGVIFESRPDALVQIAALCLKSGNAVLLKGGSEAKRTNKILSKIIIEASEKVGIPRGWMHLIETREDVRGMLKMDKAIDLIIPRGSNQFVRYIMENSYIPVLGHADGICHCFIDHNADLDMAVKIVLDAKIQYVAACNAVETLLVHRDIATEFLPKAKAEYDKHNVKLVGCVETQKIIDIDPATEEDWKTEYVDYKLSIKIVDNIDAAIDHINEYGSGHTDAIITENRDNVDLFMKFVDSANIYWNCSTRFSDGFRYGFGAEVGISTSKIHARGPVGLDGLLIYKYKLLGKGHIVDEYSKGIKSFTHKELNKEFEI